MFQEALENWYSLNLLDWPGYGDEVGLTAEAWCAQACHLVPSLPRNAPADDGPGGSVRPVALLSLFDGLGAARLAVQDALEELGQPAALSFAGYAELDAVLASAVEGYWAAGVRARGWLPYHRLAADVWDLLRQDGGRFQRLCELLPSDASALLIGGSPCQDVSPMGPGRGRTGLCGERSIHFFVFPVLAWAITWARPDLTVHVVVENAGSIKQEHLAAWRKRLVYAPRLGMRKSSMLQDGRACLGGVLSSLRLPRWMAGGCRPAGQCLGTEVGP